jgi:hypothetical protein
MRWHPDGAQAMLNLRATYLNEEWEPFWAYHVEQEDERLYSVVPKSTELFGADVDERKARPENGFRNRNPDRREPCAHPIISSTATTSIASPPSTCKST